MNKAKSKWQKEVIAIFKKIKGEKKPYIIKHGILGLIILPNVFSPKHFTDSFWFAKKLQKIVEKKSLLEIGTGIITLFCALSGAKVLATDINKEAVKNARLNFSKHKLKATARFGNIFEPIKKSEKFDFIFWNHPFNNWPKPVKDILLQAGFDYKYRGLEQYIRGAKNHLKKNGRLLLGTGGFADLKKIRQIAEKNNYRIKILERGSVPLEKGSQLKNEYIIYEFINY